MEYLKAAVSLRNMIGDANTQFLKDRERAAETPNRMLMESSDGNRRSIVMDAYSNEFVNGALENAGCVQAFVVTDLAGMTVNGKEMTYILYKGYHALIEKGLVYYQIVDEGTLNPKGPILFSNMEDNIFFTVDEPESEESSCNTMETDKVVEKGKSIVFFIGHMDEDRLTYDIQRLIFDTVNNVTKHPKLKFEFIIQIARYGARLSEELKERVRAIDSFTREHVRPAYPNSTFEFTYEEDMA